jgi:16S rRNA C967 or C1407 C5-methylase (RsmB/RsmF family)/NOL1/NOP2/fmu family ribosome biogenesis protein
VNPLPPELLHSLQRVTGFDEEQFVRVHESEERVVSIRVNPSKVQVGIQSIFPGAVAVPWSKHGYYLPSRPSFTLDPLLHAGAYYVQEASSMFIEQFLRQHVNLSSSIKVLDLCAAPGGKSTLLNSLISENSLLVSNEVVRARVNVLYENMVKWGGANHIITSNDASDFKRLKDFFDVVVVDAPCSGSGLFRRDPGAIDEWSPVAVQACSVRQQRILEDALVCLKKNGLLVYSTCSYSEEENEDICDWLMDHFPLEPVTLDIQGEWNIVVSSIPKHKITGYRFFPDKVKGEGFFVAGFRKRDGEEVREYPRTKKKLHAAHKATREIASRWLADPLPWSFFEMHEDCFVFPSAQVTSLELIFSELYIRKAGVRLGRVVKDDLVPNHELAVSGIASESLQRISLKREDALQYLRKEEVTLHGKGKGWMLIRYKDLDLGWVKMLGNRHNNYYPTEWRILKSGYN